MALQNDNKKSYTEVLQEVYDSLTAPSRELYSNINHQQIKVLQDVLASFPSFPADQIATNLIGPVSSFAERLNSTNVYTQNLNMIANMWRPYFNNDAALNLAINNISSLHMQLATAVQTPMVLAAQNSLADMNFSPLIDSINQSLSGHEIMASDMALLKTSELFKGVSDKIAYPKGVKTVLRDLNVTTAKSLVGNQDIQLDLQDKTFTTGESRATAQELNSSSAAVELFNGVEHELFTEKEMMDFMNSLSKQFSRGLGDPVGRKIDELIHHLFESKERTVGFEQDKYYRARVLGDNQTSFVDAEMGKAPYGIPSAGRFNYIDQSYFYCADTETGAVKEVEKHAKNTRIQIATLKPKHNARLVDLSVALRYGRTFFKFITLPVNEGSHLRVPKEYLIPEFVSGCCNAAGFDGIKYYGGKEPEYNNYVCWTEEWFDFIDQNIVTVK